MFFMYVSIILGYLGEGKMELKLKYEENKWTKLWKKVKIDNFLTVCLQFT